MAKEEQLQFYAPMGEFMKTVSNTNKAVLDMLKDHRETNATATQAQAQLVETQRNLNQKAHKDQVAAVNEAKTARDTSDDALAGHGVTMRSGGVASANRPTVITSYSGERLKMPPMWE